LGREIRRCERAGRNKEKLNPLYRHGSVQNDCIEL
jgi:hypothetical protein